MFFTCNFWDTEHLPQCFSPFFVLLKFAFTLVIFLNAKNIFGNKLHLSSSLFAKMLRKLNFAKKH